jgi:hypothetical protein
MKYPFNQRIDERDGVTPLTADRLHSGSNQDVGFGGERQHQVQSLRDM